ncbi:hypothetical protein TELCIR_23395, partial [Teladorsagia circumcincta]
SILVNYLQGGLQLKTAINHQKEVKTRDCDFSIALQTTYPSTKKRRLTDVVNGEGHEQPCPEASNGGQKKTEKASTDAAKRGRCGCHFEDDCFKESLLEMVKVSVRFHTYN